MFTFAWLRSLAVFSLFMELIYHEKEDSMGLTMYLKITI
jgi:hypothetical protein